MQTAGRQRLEHYAQLNQPLDPKIFIDKLRGNLTDALDTLNAAVPTLPWLAITDRKSGAIKLSPLQPPPEPRNLRRLKKAVLGRHGPIQLIDMLKETALRTGMLTHLTSFSTRETIEQSTLWERMMLVAYALGTNVGIRSVAMSSGYSEDDLRYVARRYFSIDGLRAAAAAIADATFTARQETIWGAGTTTVASDSTHFRAYDQNLFTEWHSRYGGRGVLIYWHVEKGSVAIHAQHLKCTASEVAAMIEGVMRHSTTMKVEGNYVDSHGQSEIGFGITCLLGFELLPRIKQINKAKLYRPDRDATYPALEPATTRAIRWDIIDQNYDMLIKYATAIRVGTATTEAILRRFTRNASHPVYQAMLEVGRAQKTIFIARYLGTATCNTKSKRASTSSKTSTTATTSSASGAPANSPPTAATSKNAPCSPCNSCNQRSSTSCSSKTSSPTRHGPTPLPMRTSAALPHCSGPTSPPTAK